MGTASSMDFHQFNEQYLHGLRGEDVETAAHFVSYFSRILQNKLRRHLACPEHIKDVQQETLLRAWAAVRAEGCIRQPERFGAFVSSVCDNILRESYRSRARTRALDDMQIDPADQSVGPDGALLAAEWQSAGRGRRGRVWSAVAGGSLTFSLGWRYEQGAGFMAGLSLAVGVAIVLIGAAIILYILYGHKK